MVGDGGQFLDVKLESAIAIHANRSLLARAEAHPDTGGNPKAHRSKPGGVENALPFFGRVGEDESLDARSRTARDNLVIVVNHACQYFRKMEDAHRTGFPMPRLNQGIARLPIPAALEPALTILGHDGRTLLLEFTKKCAGVRVDRSVDQTS